MQGFREQLGSNSDQSRVSYADGRGIWKEIHTDTQSTAGQHSSSGSISLEPAVLTSPSPAGVGGRTASSNKNCYIPVPSTPTPERNYKKMPGMRGSPATKVPHSPQNVNILSPQLWPLEKSPKRTQLHIASPRVTENGGLTPVVNQLTLSPTYDHHDGELHTGNMLPLASTTVARSPHLSSPASMKLKKMMKPGHGADQTPRPSSVSKSDRSPGRTWKNSFRAVSPAMVSTTFRGDQQNNAAGRVMSRELSGSFQESNGRATATCVNSSSGLPSWRGCGQAMVAPAFDREICQGGYPMMVVHVATVS